MGRPARRFEPKQFDKKTFRDVEKFREIEKALPFDDPPLPKIDPLVDPREKELPPLKEKPKDAPKNFDKNPEKFEDVILRDARLELALQPGRRFVDDDFKPDEFMLDEAVMVKVTTLKPYDRTKVMNMLRGKKMEKTHRGKSYFISDRGFDSNALHFVDERTFILVTPGEWMPVALDREAMFQCRGPLSDAVESARQKHQLVIGMNFNEPSILELKHEIVRSLQERMPRDMEPFRALEPLIEAQTAFLAADFGKEVRVQADVGFANVERASVSSAALQDALHLARLYILPMMRSELRMSIQRTIENRQDLGPLVFGETVLVPGEKPVLVAQRDLRPMFFTDGLLARADTILRKVSVVKQGSTLNMVASGRFDVALIEAEARENAVKLVKSQETETLVRKSAMNLDRILDAMQAYQDVHGKLPTSGKLSWRVQILPYMDEVALYEEFKQNEAWDSPHNIKLLPRMPKIYAPPGVKTREPHATHYQVFAGPGTIFDPNNKDGNGGQFSRGIAIVEAADATPWTRPTDLPYDAKKPLPKLGGVSAHGFHVAFMNGMVRFITIESFNEATFRNWMLSGENGKERFFK
jgi:Protein of unknown function (DUF1559)